MPRKRKCSNQTLSILSALQVQPRAWRHGYDLSQATSLKAGTLYPILMRLSDRGLLESKWQESGQAGRPPRHLYRLTAKGWSYVQEQLDELATARVDVRLQGGRA
jgi:DNA-binding PadR family transcriptional regulator